ncbi:hypothetical protein BDZ97DRAFT_1929500 [Flammula alnicola]|nr:hypothetical protein BDZ97DRAFT_1929500 [Flammula alnicola]
MAHYNDRHFSGKVPLNVATGQEHMHYSAHTGAHTHTAVRAHASQSGPGPFVQQYSTGNQFRVEPIPHHPQRTVVGNLPMRTSYTQNHPPERSSSQDPRLYYDNVGPYDMPDHGGASRHSKSSKRTMPYNSADNVHHVTGGHNFAPHQTTAPHAHASTRSSSDGHGHARNDLQQVSYVSNLSQVQVEPVQVPPPNATQWRSFAHHPNLKGEAVCQWKGGRCSAVFDHAANSDLVEHLRTRHGVAVTLNVKNPCLWEGCKSAMQFKGVGLALHIRGKHLGVNRITCMICDTIFNCEATFKAHLRDAHPEVSWY